jgi:hypothetical protein
MTNGSAETLVIGADRPITHEDVAEKSPRGAGFSQNLERVDAMLL